MSVSFPFILLAGFLTLNSFGRVFAQNLQPQQTIQAPVAHLLAAGGAKRNAGQLVVKFRRGVTANDIDGLNSILGASVLKVHPRSGLHRLSVAEVNLPQILGALRNSSMVEEAGYNYVVQSFAAPNDPDYQLSQWNFHNTAGGIWVEQAWDFSGNKGQGVVVAVIDTGVAYENFGPFVQAVDLNKNFVAPRDFYNNDDHPNDDNGHGTHVAGTIAQDTNNNLATAGIAYQASIMPLKILSWDGYGSADDLNEAIYHAVNSGARVINLSLGFSNTGNPDASGQVCMEIAGLNVALQYAYDNNVVVVAAAGNEGSNVVNCPAAYPTVIAVGATRYDGQRAYYSNGGSALDIVAPGGDLLADQNGDGEGDGVLQVSFCNDPGFMFDELILNGINHYGEFCTVLRQGTSMATPHVAATVALMLGENPSLTPASIRQYLESTARDYGAVGWDSSYGWGLLHAGAAVAAVKGGIPPPPPPTTGAVRGVVSDIATGLPISGALITMHMRADKFTTASLSDGSYSFSGLSFGDYKIITKASTYHLNHRDVSVSQNSSTVAVDFALEKIKDFK